MFSAFVLFSVNVLKLCALPAKPRVSPPTFWLKFEFPFIANVTESSALTDEFWRFIELFSLRVLLTETNSFALKAPDLPA